MAKAKKHKHSTKAPTTPSSSDDTSIKQQPSNQLLEVLDTTLGNSKIGNFILNCIIYSLDASNMPNKDKIEYIKIVEQYLLKFVQETNEVLIKKLKWSEQLYKLVFIRDHLNIEKGEESVIKYLLNNKVFGKDFFNPNKLDNNNLTLLDWLESLEHLLIKSESKKNQELIKWLKDKKGAKNSLEILQDKFNQGDYDTNVEKLKKTLEGYSRTLKRERPEEFLKCVDVILHNKRDEISQHIKLFFCKNNTKSNESQSDELQSNERYVVDTLLTKYYKDIDRNKYIEIIRSIIKNIPLKSSRIFHYEELINLYFNKIHLQLPLTKEERELLDNYTNKLVELSIDSNDDGLKHNAYKKRFGYCKYEEKLKKTILQETIEVSLKLIKYANNTEIKNDLYRLLIALHNIENGEFKISTLDQLANDFKLSGAVKEKFIKLFSYHIFDETFVKPIQKDIEIIKKTLLSTTNKQEINATIIEFLQTFIIQIGKYSVSTIKKMIDDLNINDSECVLRILTCLKCWSKNDIEQVNYKKVLGTLSKNDLKNDPIINIKVAEFYLAIENLDQAKCCLDRAEQLLQSHESSQYAIPLERYLNVAKLNLMFNVFADNNKEFLNKNWGYIKKIYSTCCTKEEEFLEAFHSIIDICQYYILTRDPETSSNSQDKINKIVDKITEDDELTFSLEIINQTTSEKKQPETQTHADNNIGASSCDVEKYSSEGKSNTEISDTATQKSSLYKENFITKCLNQWTIIHQYYQNIKKAARFSPDKKSDNHQETYQTWNISDELSYTTKSEDVVKRISKHKNIYAIIDPKLLGSLETSEQQKFTNALNIGIVKDPNHNGVKILNKYFPQLKTEGNKRLYPSTIFQNDDGAVLVIFDKKVNHGEIKRVLNSENIKVKKVPGGVDHSIQVEDYPLKYDVFPEGYDDFKYDEEVGCIGDVDPTNPVNYLSGV
ncbi:hypothetical protein [Candidatus Tisiphia endosymbiont of Micropterix aruncella]|uniref:hypothetical protein n=1 Tax=Candidatus Tisiphia endosymbiont of Micropterix aruncella TaxID=3066271 RepID=UPI003AA95F5A